MYKLLFITTGPSGAGKNTVMNHIRRTFPTVTKAVTYTTRAPRPNEVDGIDYRFVTDEEFFAKVDSGDIMEYEQVYNDYYYGSPADIFTDGDIKVMEMDWQGHRTYRQFYKNIRIVSIFLVPPSFEEIKKRILKRSAVSNLDSRIANAMEQLEHAGEYSFVILNRHKEKALQEVESIIRTELLRRQRNRSLAYAQKIIRQHKK